MLRVAVFGDNYTHDLLNKNSFGGNLISDPQLSIPGFLDDYHAF